MTADTSLPGFEDDYTIDEATTRWNVLRWNADRDLMGRLLAAARASGGPHLAFWVKTRRSTYQGDWYGLWEDPRGPLPELSEEKAYGGSGPDTDFSAFARTQCRFNVFVLSGWLAQSAGKDMKPGWSGFVLDLTDRPGDPLADLVRSLHPPAPVPAALPRP
jgi:hypothetical protein